MVLPYKDLQHSKKTQVALMFNNIAGKYDLLNHLLSFNIDKYWRKKAIRCIKPVNEPMKLLDVATGTGDFAFTALSLHPEKITGIDISESMLEVGKKKAEKRNRNHEIEFLYGDAENIPFPDHSFHVAISGFGVRNFEDLEKGIGEIFRVLKAGGQIVILEFSRPVHAPFKQIYAFYFSRVLPWIGRVISKDKSAYGYLPDSVKNFPDGNTFIRILEKAGFTECRFTTLTFGIATIYLGYKS